ncbi:MAG: polyribonucleotide nucleotidyltransferase [Candidatus Woykebacteria bacterium RIFCSPHIGHO2_01_FULL_39_12]|uniref:Polyribonucleotide nucleotidyltransferase n=2 Tax=Candidatus Woykeibacteriota TaxID=1817899 RepID=A0A1G1WEG4_9BACT|nr:MAG: polyribonucleotide nucleotidyltransferase [Candidatus Woykebacteria bacterium RBG_16_39_9b]OGY28156.1 MAG: polyribonucleotide nucleotidyltransferase [Candidatus Woykebacteria bacterium RIFCSPHIGHO2_01_FULL_39_12]
MTQQKQMKKISNKEIQWADRTLSLEVGKMASQADSAVLVKYGDTLVLVTVVEAPPREDVDYFPLVVDYEERLYAAGRISTSRFIKREGRPSESAILNGRLIDRSIRPLFPKDLFNEIQVIVTVLSYDQENDPDIVALIGASVALSISSIPWDGQVAAVKVGYKDGQFVLNPTRSDEESSDLSLTISFNKDKVVMIEAGANQVSKEIFYEAIQFAKKSVEPVFALIEELTKEVGLKKHKILVEEIDLKVKNEIVNHIKENFKAKLFNPEKGAEESASEDFKEEIYAKFEGKLSKTEMGRIFEKTVKEMVRERIVDEETRPDGRKLDEIRQIDSEVGLLPRAHGSALFQRGDTQVLTVATLGSTSLEQLIEGMEGEATKRFMHHYTFPPFSTGEVRRLGAPSRREIGHGALVEKALRSVIPNEDDFPYTIRLVSEVLSSSGSTSMAATCGATLSLMDAGIPIISPVSGVAIGLVEEGDKFKILTDIQALEDFYGDMDFKIAGTEEGITAVQLDVKIDGLNDEMLKKALESGEKGRAFILSKMLNVLPRSRKEISKYAPQVTVLHIPPKKIGEVIGAGGKTINKIISETGVAIDIEDDGSVMISSTDENGAKRAADWIKALTHDVKPGEIYEGVVKRVVDFGCFVEILPGKEGLVHISQLAPYRVEDINKEVKVGQKMKVKVVEVDNQGRINLTHKSVT